MARVLVVDDEKSIRFALNRILTDAGHEVDVSAHAVDARAVLADKRFDVAIVDRILSDGQDGCDLVKHIKNTQPFCETIMMSGYPTFESASEMLQYEIFAYLTKPIRRETLCRTVKGAEERNRGKKELEEKNKDLESQLVQAQKMEAIGTLAGGIAHDFNNILGIIMGYTELSLLDTPEETPVFEHLTEALKASNRAKDLVRQILTFSRQNRQDEKLLAIGTIIEEALKMLRASLPATIEIQQEIQDSGLIMADPTQIHQIIMNLSTNAAHAMGEKDGVLNVSVSNTNIDDETAEQNPDLTPGPYVKLTVSDTGHGMSPEVKERIFEPYYTTKEVGQGTGWGLSVVHGIVQDHGGAIDVHSVPGEGTTFEIFFPKINLAEDRT